jgi:hypothetical protein
MIAQVRTLPEAHAFFEKLRSLQTVAATCVKLLEKEKVGTVEPSDGIVELELADYDEKGIEPERLKQLIITVTDLHTNLARIHGIEGDQLRFKYFDSGSALRVGIECAMAIALSMTTLLFQWWDKLRFSRYETFDRKIESASKGLTFMETVKQSVEKQVINEETGKILTRRVLVDVDRMLGIGATLPFDTEVTVDQHKLLVEMRDVKLLESSGPSSEPEEGNGEPNDPLREPGRKFRHVE